MVTLGIGLPLVAWWLSTALVLGLVSARRRSRPYGMALASVLAVGAAWALVAFRDDATIVGSVGGFVCGLLLWGWLEASYLLGYLTGPRSEACPPGVSGVRRFGYGVLASLYHELAVLAMASGLWLLHRDAENTTGLYAFVILWLMRWSAKLHLFLGVSRFDPTLLPERMQYLKSYMGAARTNSYFSYSLALGAAAFLTCLGMAVSAEASDADRVRGLLLASLVALGMLEHGFMVVSFPDSKLWTWLKLLRPGGANSV